MFSILFRPIKTQSQLDKLMFYVIFVGSFSFVLIAFIEMMEVIYPNTSVGQTMQCIAFIDLAILVYLVTRFGYYLIKTKN